eukprot:scaffold111106_cov16-Tisochrysis_lutea.AAC.1
MKFRVYSDPFEVPAFESELRTAGATCSLCGCAGARPPAAACATFVAHFGGAVAAHAAAGAASLHCASAATTAAAADGKAPS